MSYIDNEILEKLIGTMVEGFVRIEKKLDQMNRLKECMNGDRLLDNVDLAELLGVSQRTLARYRQEGKIKYYSVEKNGKSFYLASEIQSFLLQRGKDKSKHSKKCTFYTLRFGCSFAAVNTIKPQLL